MVWSTKLVDGRACGMHHNARACRRWMYQVYYTLVDCNPLPPLLRFVTDLLLNLFLHCCAAVGKILTDTVTHRVALVAEVAELLVPRTLCIGDCDRMSSSLWLSWPGGVVVAALDLRLKRSRVRISASRFQATTLGKLFTHVCQCHKTV